MRDIEQYTIPDNKKLRALPATLAMNENRPHSSLEVTSDIPFIGHAHAIYPLRAG